MPPATLRSPAEWRLFSRLRSLIVLRLVVVTVLFGVVIGIHISKYDTYTDQFLNAYYVLILLCYGYSLAAMMLLERARALSLLAYANLVADTLLISAFVYATGGSESIFSFLYFIIVFTAAALLYRRGAWVIASSSALLYAWVFAMDYWDLLPSFETAVPSLLKFGDVSWTKLTYNIFAFYFIGYLSGHLADSARRSEAEADRRAEELRELEAFNRHVVHSMRNGLVVTDIEGRITYANEAAADLLGVPISHLLGLGLEALFDRRGWPSAALQAPSGVWEQATAEDGGPTHLKFNLFPFNDDQGHSIGRLLVVEDLTRLKSLEERAQKAEWLGMIGQMAAGIAHEIRNPLASMSGSLELLQSEPAMHASPENQRLFDIIHREIHRLDRLVNDFLKFARPPDPQLSETGFHDLLEDTLTLLQARRQVGPEIDLDCRVESDLRLRTDPNLLRQVLWNLLNNAVEAMPEGGTLRIGARRMPGGIEISVADTGMGIAPEVMGRLFTPFFTTKERGSGLGLATVRRLLDSLGGEVAIETRSGGGTRATVRLPDAA